MGATPHIHSATNHLLSTLAPSDAEREVVAANSRLAVYGTLAPGRANHHFLASIQSQSWTTGHVRGALHPEGWGAALGYPALVFDESAAPVSVHVLESPDLPNHWPRLDEFEGPAYRRTVVPVTLAAPPRIIAANIYLLAGEQP